MLAPYLSECALCRVSPLYQHVFPPAYAPSLSFIGLPWKVVPFPQYELQAKWVARVLSGRVSLPSQEVMTVRHLEYQMLDLHLRTEDPDNCRSIELASNAQ